MSSKSVYSKKFQELLSLEEKAATYYSHLINHVQDKTLQEKFKSIYNDEKKHASIVQGFLAEIFQEP